MTSSTRTLRRNSVVCGTAAGPHTTELRLITSFRALHVLVNRCLRQATSREQAVEALNRRSLLDGCQRGNVFAQKSVRSRPFQSHEKCCAGLRHGGGVGVPTTGYGAITRE